MSSEKNPAIDSAHEEAKIVLRFTLNRMMRSLFGELDILAVRCLGLLGSSDQRPIIFERYELWKSCLVVAREAVKNLKEPSVVMEKLTEILLIIENIRAAFDQLITIRTANQGGRRQLRNLFSDNFKLLSKLTEEINTLLDLQMPFFDKKKNLAKTIGERSLVWLCKELEGPSVQTQ